MEHYIIDRFEGSFAVCEKDGETLINIEKRLLPVDVSEGSVLKKCADGTFVRDIDEENLRRNRLFSMANDLFDE